MAETPAPLAIPLDTLGILTPRAFDATVEQQITGITPRPEVIDQIGAMAAEVDPAFGLPVAASGLTIVIRDGRGLVPHRWDGRYEDAGQSQSYIPLSEVGNPPGNVAAVSKAQLMKLGRPVLEISAGDFSRPLGPILASALTGVFHHADRGWMRGATVLDFSKSPWGNARRLSVVERVDRDGLEPFTLTRSTTPQ